MLLRSSCRSLRREELDLSSSRRLECLLLILLLLLLLLLPLVLGGGVSFEAVMTGVAAIETGVIISSTSSLRDLFESDLIEAATGVGAIGGGVGVIVEECKGEGEGLIVSPSSNSTSDVFLFGIFMDRKNAAGMELG